MVAITAYQPGDANHEEADEVTKIINVVVNSIYDIKNDGKGATVYNLQGRKLKAPQKGVNIVNGKKVIVR